MADSGIYSGIGAAKGVINFDVQLSGMDAVRRSTLAIQKAVDAELAKALFVCAKHVEGEAKKSLAAGNKSGRTYTMRAARAGEEPTAWFTINGRSVGFVKRHKPHTASAPGEAPATDTGALVRNINVDSRTSNEGGRLVGKVVAGRGVKYAAWLEFGTSKIAPRPFMFPALERSKDFIRQRLAKAVVDGMWKGAAK